MDIKNYTALQVEQARRDLQSLNPKNPKYGWYYQILKILAK